MKSGVVARATPPHLTALSLDAAACTEDAAAAPNNGVAPGALNEKPTSAEQVLAGQYHLLELLAGGKALPEVLDAVCLHIERLISGSLCTILLIDESGRNLRSGNGPSLPPSFHTAINGLAIGPGSGVCGTAAYRRQTVIAADALNDPCCVHFQELLRQHDIAAGWSVPIVDAVSDDLLGTFAVYHRTVRRPTSAELAHVEKASYLAGLAIRSRQTEEALRQSEARARALLQNAADVVTLVDADGVIRYESPAIERIVGYTAEERVGSNLRVAVHPADLPALEHVLANVRAERGRSMTTEVRHRHRDGQYRILEATLTNLLDEPSVSSVVINARDVTERRVTETRYRSLVEHLPAITYLDVVEPSGKTRAIYVSPRVTEIVGWTPEDCLADPDLWDRLIHPDDQERVTAEVARAKRTAEPFDREYRVIARDGRIVWIHDRSVVVAGAAGDAPMCQGVRFDVTERKAAEEQLAHAAFHDPLTGLANRRLLLDRLQGLLHGTGDNAPAVLFLDLDGFKAVNDRVGHLAGDELLTAIGDRLAASVRADDTAARFGGDEFAILLKDVSGPDEARRAGQRLHDALKPPFSIQGHDVVVEASIGVAMAGPPLTTTEALLRAADVALYRAKGMGSRGLALFDPELDGPALRQREREAELRLALERQELRIAYQPIIDLTTDTVLGVEALVRWDHPRRGPLPPAAFVPLAEETGVIVPIGYWLLGEASRQLREWEIQSSQHPALHLSVNLSARQFGQDDLIDQLESLLGASGFPPERLTFDIPEAALLTDPRSAAATIRALRALGVSVTIDDFGSAFAALGSLKHLVVDDLKIDISCIAALGRSRGDNAMVRASVSMAKEIGVRVTAEGIETAEQVGFMRGLGCDRAQGFHFAPPLALSEMAIFLRSGRH